MVSRNCAKAIMDLRKYGWLPKPLPGEGENMVIGNNRLIDPVDGKDYDFQEALRIQEERNTNERQ